MNEPLPNSHNSWSRPVAAPVPPPVATPRAYLTTPPNKSAAKITYAIIGGFIAVCILIGVAYNGYQKAPVVIPTPARPAPPPTARDGFAALKAAANKTDRADMVADAIAAHPKKLSKPGDRQELVAFNQDALDGAKVALKLSYQEPNSATTMIATFPWYPKFRHLARTQSLAGTVAWEEHKPREAAGYWLDAVTIGRRIPRQVGVIARLVGIACESIGRRPAWDYLEQMDVNTATYCLTRLDALESEKLPLSATLEEEKWSAQNCALDLMQHPGHYNDPAERVDASEERRTAKVFHTYQSLVSRKVINDTIGAYMDKLIARSKTPYIKGNHEITPPPELFTTMFRINLAPVRCKYTSNEAGDALLRTALALRVYHLKNHDYPANLAALVTAKILPAVPDDPFALPGTPLAYRRAAGDHYVLYSIGPDGKDDGGRGIVVKGKHGKETRAVSEESKGDMVAGWYHY